jgi:lipopolysaccharide/colanic/teichoic acid biosynthesis glycosyltransferase
MKGLTVRQRAVKRVVDIVVSGIALALLWPGIVVAATIARVETGEAGLFHQTRVGRHGRYFALWKIRTMRTDPAWTSTVTVDGDPRITRCGSVFRRTKIDELPQLLNVLRGDMSLVGPRPDVPGFHDHLEGDDRNVLSVRPGITGPAALRFADEERTLATVPDPAVFSASVLFPLKVAIDRQYVEQYRFRDDIRCLALTMRNMLFASGSSHWWDVIDTGVRSS